jgi:hypothetical protein
MKQSKLMKERIRRVAVLFSELGYQLVEAENLEECYSAGFQDESGYQGGVYIDRDSRFLELAYSFAFSPEMRNFVRKRFDTMMKIAYEYGCYVSLQTEPHEFTFSLFSKLYYNGLSYLSLKATLLDFLQAVNELKELVQLKPNKERGGEIHGSS